jgi:hypothetical protein
VGKTEEATKASRSSAYSKVLPGLQNSSDKSNTQWVKSRHAESLKSKAQQ